MHRTRNSLLAATALLISSPGHAQEALPDIDTLRELTSNAIVSIKRVPETGPEAIAFYVGRALNEVPSSDYLDALISDAAASDTLEPSDIAQQVALVPSVAATITSVVREATIAGDLPAPAADVDTAGVQAAATPASQGLAPATPADPPLAVVSTQPDVSGETLQTNAEPAATEEAAAPVEVASTTPVAEAIALAEDPAPVAEVAETAEAGVVEQLAEAAIEDAAEPRTYVVAQGDSLASIALEFYGDPQEYQRILEANRGIINSADSISIGQALVIPE